jgi:hypothetical protein
VHLSDTTLTQPELSNYRQNHKGFALARTGDPIAADFTAIFVSINADPWRTAIRTPSALGLGNPNEHEIPINPKTTCTRFTKITPI